MNIQLNEEGARIYIAGNTYPIRDCIKAAGAHWDGERKMWWIGKGKRAAIEACVAQVSPAAPAPGERPQETVEECAPVKAKAEYKGKKYYVLAEARDGSSAKLTTLDGKLVFWAKAENGMTIVKRYGRERGFRGYGSRSRDHELEYPTLRSLRSFIEDKKQAAETGNCPKCEKMFARGSWAPYCGSGDYEDCSCCGTTVQILR